MKIILGILVLVVIGGSIFADYKWKQWIKARREAREHDPGLQQRHR
jgi:hypothetical protein